MRNLQAVANECMEELKSIQVPFQTVSRWDVNTRATTRWGQCRFRNSMYSINISSRLLDERVPEKSLKTVIIHELLHTVKGGLKHTGEWKRYAEIVRNKLGYEITRTNSEDNYNIPQELKKVNIIKTCYSVKCDKCGYLINRQKISKLIQHPSYYSHKDCGGHFTRVK